MTSSSTKYIPEYKHTKRKKYRSKDVSRSEWKAIQEKNLSAFRDLEFGDWPVKEIVKERRNFDKGGRPEYLVEWESHPITNAIWRPEWVWDQLFSTRPVMKSS